MESRSTNARGSGGAIWKRRAGLLLVSAMFLSGCAGAGSATQRVDDSLRLIDQTTLARPQGSTSVIQPGMVGTRPPKGQDGENFAVASVNATQVASKPVPEPQDRANAEPPRESIFREDFSARPSLARHAARDSSDPGRSPAIAATHPSLVNAGGPMDSNGAAEEIATPPKPPKWDQRWLRDFHAQRQRDLDNQKLAGLTKTPARLQPPANPDRRANSVAAAAPAKPTAPGEKLGLRKTPTNPLEKKWCTETPEKKPPRSTIAENKILTPSNAVDTKAATENAVPPKNVSSPPMLSKPTIISNFKDNTTSRPSLAVDRLEFCDQVLGFGIVDPPARAYALPGERVLLYAEARDYAVRDNNGKLETILGCTVVLETLEGQECSTIAFRDLVETVRQRNQDFYCCFQFSVPRELTPGSYRVRLRLDDRITSEHANRAVILRIRAKEM